MRKSGGRCLKDLEMEWNRKDGRGNKEIKRGGKQGQGVGALKGGGLEPHYELWYISHASFLSVYTLLTRKIFHEKMINKADVYAYLMVKRTLNFRLGMLVKKHL